MRVLRTEIAELQGLLEKQKLELEVCHLTMEELEAKSAAAFRDAKIFAQIRPLVREARGAGKGSGKRGGRQTCPEWFFWVALPLIVHCPSPEPTRALLRIFHKTWLPFLGHES